MTYNQWTQCNEAQNHNMTNPKVQAVLLGLYVTLPAAFLPVLLALAGAGGVCLAFLAPIFFFAGIVGYCYWWLHDRLICLPDPANPTGEGGSDQLAIGVLIDINRPEDNSFPDIDTDYSIGILLASNPLGADHATVAASSPFGYLVAEQPVTQNRGLIFTGHKGVDFKHDGHPELDITSEILHCEFEGAGVNDMFHAAQVALFIAFLALVACMMPGIGWIAALIIALISLLVGGVGLIIAVNDTAQPSDVNPSLGELHTNDANHMGADILVIYGHWIYNSGHNFDQSAGWNEIHPVKYCTKAGQWTGDWPPDIGDVIVRWQGVFGQATDPVTLAKQKLPQNRWQVHPIIDGCQPSIIV